MTTAMSCRGTPVSSRNVSAAECASSYGEELSTGLTSAAYCTPGDGPMRRPNVSAQCVGPMNRPNESAQRIGPAGNADVPAEPERTDDLGTSALLNVLYPRKSESIASDPSAARLRHFESLRL